jgi:hypothetical protein
MSARMSTVRHASISSSGAPISSGQVQIPRVRIAVIKPADYSMSDAVAILTGAIKPPEAMAA